MSQIMANQQQPTYPANPGGIPIWINPMPGVNSVPSMGQQMNWNQPVTQLVQAGQTTQPLTQPQQTNQQPTQTQNQGYLTRIINSESDILPIEIPMNNNWALFVTSDFNTVVAKKWGSQGLVDTERFVRMPKEEQRDTSSEVVANADIVTSQDLNQIMNQLNDLKELINTRFPGNSVNPSAKSNKSTKKEVEADA